MRCGYHLIPKSGFTISRSIFENRLIVSVLLVADTLYKDSTSGQLFVFRNKKADKIRMLYWEESGFWLVYKRNEKSRFIFPGISNDAIELSVSQFQRVLSELDFIQQEEPEKLYFSRFY
ncbi:IS66 family insertion sequence element accessory protein TnpB [uncultured Microbulbifer sp.]|uniref:IS66 family insertion sequence element accessory protein TnpB n=1 Tax=uncultured Microbulbifer sp. TaxID=348147 RepID=UPI002612464F|nr:IS66 family insertion sequence element accessory protein TnpB [uncultured Microbulbifer sp.]